MGCDIHLFVERRDSTGHWKTADTWTPDKYAEDGETPRMQVDYDARFYSGRNYDLFSILADVRNGRGFAGVKTGEGFVPIAEPRGLPEDVSPEVKAESDGWDSDGHSHSFFTVAELLAYDWTQQTKHCGWLSAHEFWKWNRYPRAQGEGPEEYCGGVDGASVKKLTEQEMQTLLEPLGKAWTAESVIKEKHQNTYCFCEWTLPYYKSVPHFLGRTIPRLLSLGAQSDVRIVFWFDN